jgi:hypothetical protein
MSNLGEKSGPWRGQWSQVALELRGSMRVHLTFLGEDIRGGGVDSGGAFTIDGSYSHATDEVAMTKLYARLTVIYRGKWDGAMITGTSSIIGGEFYDHGEFELWPESEETSLAEMALESVGVP